MRAQGSTDSGYMEHQHPHHHYQQQQQQQHHHSTLAEEVILQTFSESLREIVLGIVPAASPRQDEPAPSTPMQAVGGAQSTRPAVSRILYTPRIL